MIQVSENLNDLFHGPMARRGRARGFFGPAWAAGLAASVWVQTEAPYPKVVAVCGWIF